MKKLVKRMNKMLPKQVRAPSQDWRSRHAESRGHAESREYASTSGVLMRHDLLPRSYILHTIITLLSKAACLSSWSLSATI